MKKNTSFIFSFFLLIFSFTVITYLSTKQTLVASNLQLDEQAATIMAIKKVMPAVVSIGVTETQELKTIDLQTGLSTTSKENINLGAGTGFLITADGLIITNKHVVEAAKNTSAGYRITLNDGKKYYAQLIGKDPLNDLALLKIFDKNLPFVELGDSDKMPLGSTVIAIGNALGLYQNSVTKGIVSGLNRDIAASDQSGAVENLGNVIQTDAQINLGNSGGPLIDLSGRVIGVNVAVDSSGQSIGFAIPINDAKPVITSAREKGRIIRPRLGIHYIMLDEDLAIKYKLAKKEGAWIHSVDATPSISLDSPAAKAGLLDGDIITEIDGKKINKDNVLLNVVQKYKPGQRIGFKIIRNNTTITKIAVLDEFKE